jgi:hypothetical protein
MITKITEGDILSPKNHADVIIGMNAELAEVNGIGLPFTWQIRRENPIPLGTVFSFELDDERQLHLLVCHHIGEGGWVHADKYVRFGLDYLWQSEPQTKKFSSVQIGTGRIGERDGADFPAIHTAMATSHLPLELFIFKPLEPVAVEANVTPLRTLTAFRSWNIHEGELALAS